MALKDTMRRRQASKRGCLAEECYGESPEACIALREKEPLAYLVRDASQSRPKWLERHQSRGQRKGLYCHGRTGQPVLPCMPTGEPQRADGAASNTPPTAFRLSHPH